MEGNVVTDLDSVLSDKSEENDKISKTILDDDEVLEIDNHKLDEESKNDDSFVLINNVNSISDTTQKNNESEKSKDIISLDSSFSIDDSDKQPLVEHSTDSTKATKDDPSTKEDNEPEGMLNVSLDDENLLDELQSVDFNAHSSPKSGSSDINTSMRNVSDTYEVIENHKLEDQDELEHEQDEEEEHEQEEEEHDQEEEEHDQEEEENLDDDDETYEKSKDDQNQQMSSDDEPIEIDSDEEDIEESDDDDGSEDEENDINSVSSDNSEDDDVEVIAKPREPEKPKYTSTRKKNFKFDWRVKLKKRSMTMLISPKRKKYTMHLKQSSAITSVTEHPNGNNICQSFLREKTILTDKAKEVDEMVQILPNECAEEIDDDDDDVCLIEDSPVKVNGKYEREDQHIVEQNVKVERLEEDEDIENDKVDNSEKEKDSMTHLPEVIINEEVQTNGNEGDSSSNKSNPPIAENIISVSEQVPKATDSKSEETVPIIQEIVPDNATEVVSKPKPNYKRSRSTTPVEDVQPTKRLKTELEESFIGHNKRVQEYIDKTSNDNIAEINNHVQGLLAEVQELDAMAAAKEQEWNNILYLKNVKQEIIYRLTRKKHVIEINSSKVGEVEDYTILEQQPSLSQKITKENRNSLLLSNASHNSNQNSYIPSISTTEAVKSIINNRAAMNTSDLAKEKVNAAKMHRNLLPKPELSGRSSPNINFIASLASTNLQHLQQQQKAQQQFIEQQQQHQIYQQALQQQKNNAAITEQLLNGHHQTQIGRQGAIKDVKSIIEDFRQKNPERAPRRGRRLKGLNSDGTVTSSRSNLSTDGLLTRQSVESRVSELGLLLAKDGCSRPSSADSSPGNSNLATNNNISTANANITFNDVLMQYSKMNERPSEMLTSSSMMRQQSGYPEVTLHPVNSQPSTTIHQNDSSQSNSLLHGILTKNTRPSSTSTFNTFSPTLARLLTAPERITPLPNNYRLPSSTPIQPKSSGINLTKPRNEITITPVMSNPANIHQTILQQQLQRQHDAVRMRIPMMDDEADDSADRLVIDEGEIQNEQSTAVAGREFPENEFPDCQGCKKREAQFVCAGCGNQWYCSRICQVQAWDEHCEVCSG